MKKKEREEEEEEEDDGKSQKRNIQSCTFSLHLFIYCPPFFSCVSVLLSVGGWHRLTFNFNERISQWKNLQRIVEG